MIELSLRESSASIARRARVIVFRIKSGEMVAPEPWDPVFKAVLELLDSPTPHGNAFGAVPEVM